MDANVCFCFPCLAWLNFLFNLNKSAANLSWLKIMRLRTRADDGTSVSRLLLELAR